MNSKVITKFFKDDFKHVISVVDLYEEEWFCGTQLASILEIGVNRSILKIVDEDNRKKLKFLKLAISVGTFMKQDPERAKWCGTETIFVNLAGVLELIKGSQIQKAIDLRQWLASTVLIKLCTDGQYFVNKNQEKITRNAMDVEDQKNKEAQDQVIRNMKHKLLDSEQKTVNVMKDNKQKDMILNKYQKRILEYQNREAQMQNIIRNLSSRNNELGKIINQTNKDAKIDNKNYNQNNKYDIDSHLASYLANKRRRTMSRDDNELNCNIM
ncbi:BRO-C [Chrysodeixis chalcites nucleopolyhedrovirus]|uniref:BRO-C n=1 Tax=Chrysodeixis chalcites nucleopolyhedrovirus TaxID=320432 RepID=Q4KT10_9ABAC|nr:BRO-C [Chrysodeixis chalcites nucleopolyhedrovirus]AAY84001.1 BRO-C [Chrysodeixis chalcites nucleopolyhedrovirus]AGC36284.1 BRO-C protein [Chrysodeixis chalcites SNPV TF1-A]AGE61479.1 BRO-C [Chrysodeixis chalcites nucleopolyhedrovirus]AGE61630.1 BRO-C [Chrysodeixis chalcites nucleopolyhedrovirus]